MEMQCVWFITEDGESYQRQTRLGLALKRFHAINKIFDDWIEDQFDFHSFSLRKGMIRAYVDQLRWEDSLRAHPFYHRAALGAINTYILLHERPHLAHEGLANGGLDGMLRKLKRKWMLLRRRPRRTRTRTHKWERKTLRRRILIRLGHYWHRRKNPWWKQLNGLICCWLLGTTRD